METLILTVHIIACILLVVVVLLQSGHEGMGAIFGGGSSTMFGAKGAGGLLVKVTTVLAAVFLFTSLTYNIMTSSTPRSDVSRELSKSVEEPAPASQTPPAGTEAPAAGTPAQPEQGAQQ